MKRFVLLTAILAPVIVMAFIIGCGSSDKSTNDSLLPGDTTNPSFQLVSDFLGEGIAENVSQSINLSFELWDSIPDVTASPRDHYRPMITQAGDSVSLTYTYAYSNGWHIFDFEAYSADITDTVVVSGIDSIRFLSEGTPMQFPDSTVDALIIHPHFSINTYVNGSSISSDQALTLSNLSNNPTQPVTVNGASVEIASLVFDDSNSTCTLDMSSTLGISNVVVLLEGDECPSSGSMNLLATLDLACIGVGDNLGDSLNVNGAWNLTAAYTGTATNLRYSDGTTEWNVTDSCGNNPPAGIGRWMHPRE